MVGKCVSYALWLNAWTPGRKRAPYVKCAKKFILKISLIDAESSFQLCLAFVWLCIVAPPPGGLSSLQIKDVLPLCLCRPAVKKKKSPFKAGLSSAYIYWSLPNTAMQPGCFIVHYIQLPFFSLFIKTPMDLEFHESSISSWVASCPLLLENDDGSLERSNLIPVFYNYSK